MNAQLFSPLFGGITNTPPTVESPQLYSSWSTCADDTNAAASLQDGSQKRAQINLSYSGSGPDMFGLVSSILEEPDKQEPAADWNALSRLFPPMWSTDSENSFSGLFPKNILENKDLATLADIQHPYEGNLREACSTESLKKDLDGFPLPGSWHALSHPCPQSPEKMFGDAAPSNKVFKQRGINQPDSLEYQNTRSYDKQSNSDGGRSLVDFSTFSSQVRVKGIAHKEYPKMDEARGALGGSDREGPRQYFSQLSNNSSSDGIWDLVGQENSLSSEGYPNFPAAHGSQQFGFPPLYVCTPASNKENTFPNGANTKLQETLPPNTRHPISTEATLCNTECKIPACPPKASCNTLPLKPAPQKTNSSYNGYTWLDAKILNASTASCVAYRKPTDSQPPSAHSNRSSANQPAVRPAYSQISLASPSRKDGKLQMSNNIPNGSVFSSSLEKQKKPSPIGHAQHDSSMTSEGLYGKIPVSAPSSRLSPQYSANHRFHNKPSRFNANERTQNEGKGKNNGILYPGYAGPNRAQLDALRRKQDQNGSSLADFINPSFLPLFPLASGYKHTPGFPPFVPPPFPAQTNVAFSPLLFPFSELVDLFHYDDFHHLSPFVNDLFCAEMSAPCFAFPPPLNGYRPPKNRSGPANELHIHLEECYDQWRALERERKKVSVTEELASLPLFHKILLQPPTRLAGCGVGGPQGSSPSDLALLDDSLHKGRGQPGRR
ncbi:meiosis-specific coiled-coil domain-containing protein MEIOC-like [Sphaerodactylus townsendi]|uniref:meiosis-specific coiled-coil domain-containing protein MEIOC-like n=1 Tax=Sphaerodactylus townsendi TaxID=933632 RepID=UPI0020265E99|nr:meiosis-specific coiled-coil domain-containing protein MEIOC-like [Sphaerodactylus townsendi]